MAAQLEHLDWLTGRVPAEVRTQIRRVVEVLGYIPHEQPLAVITADGVVLAANRPLLDLVGCSEDDLLESEWSDLMPGWDQRAMRWAAADMPDTHTFEAHLCCAGPVNRWTRVVAVPVVASDDLAAGPPTPATLAAWTVFVSDDTPRLPAPQDRRRRETADLLLDSPGEYAVKLDARGSVEFVSPSLCRVLGMRPADLVGRPLVVAHDAVEGLGAQVDTLCRELATPPYRAEREMPMSTPGDVRTIVWTFEALLGDGGGLQGVFGLGRDVTERRAAEAAARRRLDLETMLAEVSSRLAVADAAGTEAALGFALSRLGEVAGLDAVTIHELTADGASVVAWREWRRRHGVTSGRSGPALRDLPWLHSRLLRRDVVTVAAVEELPAEAKAERRLWTAAGSKSVLVAPLVVDARIGGFLTLTTSAEPRAWDDDDHYVLQVAADQIAGKLVWAADARNLSAVSETLLSFGPDFAANLAALCSAAGRVTGADFVLYCRRRGDEVALAATWNAPPGLAPAVRLAGGVCHDVLGRQVDDVVVMSRLQDSYYARTSPIVREHRLQGFVGYPVRREGAALAALVAFFASDVELRASQLELVRMLGRAAVVEESRRLAHEESERSLAQIEEAMERTVATLSTVLAARDPYTQSHELRVAALAAAIGAGLGLGQGEVRLLRLAATVHDIGKIAVPAEFLSKPTRLTDDEFAVIRQHSQAGYDLLRPAALPDVVMQAVLQHHERLDGSGYPLGLVGAEIGLFGRVLAVADVAEAMSSHRPYRAALGVGPALAELESGRGTRFDEDACDVCFTLFRDRGFSFESPEPVPVV